MRPRPRARTPSGRRRPARARRTTRPRPAAPARPSRAAARRPTPSRCRRTRVAGPAPAPVRWVSTARRSLKSSSGSLRSSQYLNTSASTLACVSLRPSTLPSASGPNDDTVARSCAPSLPVRLSSSIGKAGGPPGDAGLLRARLDARAGLPGGGQPRDVALDVGDEHRHARGRQALGHQLQRLGLAGAGRARHQTMAVHHRQRDPDQRLRVALAVMHRRPERITDGEPAPGNAVRTAASTFASKAMLER